MGELLGEDVQFHEVVVPPRVGEGRLATVAAAFTQLATDLAPNRALVWPPVEIQGVNERGDVISSGYVIPSMPDPEASMGFVHNKRR